MKRYLAVLLFTTILLPGLSCHRNARQGLPFSEVKQIRFTEVRRTFDNGLVFDKQGYQLQPAWRLFFVSDDSVQVYSLDKHRYYGFHVYYDHDRIFNMIDSWLVLRHMSADSLVFQSLRVAQSREIEVNDEGSKVIMTFYSESFIHKRHLNFSSLGLPTARDTNFIRQRSEYANANHDSAFAARQPAVLTSNSKLVTIEKVKNAPKPFEDFDPAMDYLYPEFNIVIHKAYENFDYTFSAFVDDKGRLFFGRSNIPYSHEYKKAYEDVMRAILNGYLSRYVNVKPGRTLGVAHTSYILLNVTGRTG